MSYRDNKRERSKSPDRRDRDRDYDRGRGRDRSRDRRDDRSGRREPEKDQFDRDILPRHGQSGQSSRNYQDDNDRRIDPKFVPQTAVQKLHSKAALDEKRRARMELIKNITHGGSDDEDIKQKFKKQRVVDADGNLEETQDDDEEDDEEDMMAALGFSGFNTTKGKQVTENVFGAAVGAISKHKERKYRQYMNRRGGFNRPLQKMD